MKQRLSSLSTESRGPQTGRLKGARCPNNPNKRTQSPDSGYMCNKGLMGILPSHCIGEQRDRSLKSILSPVRPMSPPRPEPWTFAVLLAVLMLSLPLLAGCLGIDPATLGENQSNQSSDGSNPTENLPPGSDPANQSHVHDLWDGDRRRPLIDGSYGLQAIGGEEEGLYSEVGPASCDAGVISNCYGVVTIRPPAPEDGQRFVVPPGTGSIEVSVDWSTPTIQGVEIEAVPAFERRWLDLGVIESSGGTVVFNASDAVEGRDQFPLEWTDDGHAPLSRWMFEIDAHGPTEWVHFGNGSIDVSVDVVRGPGPLPREPPHPPWYEGTSVYRVAEARTDARNPVDDFEGFMNTTGSYVPAEMEHPVPPGTEKVVVSVRADIGRTLPDHLDDASVSIRWSSGPYYGWLGPHDLERRINFTLPVRATMTDSVYTSNVSNSTWSFGAYVHGSTYTDPIFGGRDELPTYWEGELKATVLATNQAGAEPGTLLSLVSEE